MRSADPMYHSGSPPLAKPQIRECSRNSPMIDRTRTLSDRPGTPGWSEHAPRTISSILTPARAAS